MREVLLARLGARPELTPPNAPAKPPHETTPPIVELLSPEKGANFEGEGHVVVTARASNEEALSKVELLWHYQGLIVMDCASPPAVATCSQEGDTYHWRIRVGTGPRSFFARANDVAGNVAETDTRSITLTAHDEGEPPSAPVVTVEVPASGTIVHPEKRVEIQVCANDDQRVAFVDLWWIYESGTSYHYALHPQGGDLWTVALRPFPREPLGERRLRVSAHDDDGNQTVAPDVIVSIE